MSFTYVQTNKKCFDLRRAGYVSDVLVFKAKKNGQPGRFLRIEPPTYYDSDLRKAVPFTKRVV